MTTPIRIDTLPDLQTIATCLEGLEETIIHKLIDRAQFAHNRTIYLPGKSGFRGAGRLSLFELRLRRHEEMDAEFGRFQVPEERPYLKKLPASRRTTIPPPSCLAVDDFDVISQADKILTAYQSLIPRICPAGDDAHHGSSVEHDVFALQAIGRRIHFGALYVSESKYQSDPPAYDELIAQRDTEGLKRLLTRPEVEERILDRVAQKVEHLQLQINETIRRRIPPEAVLEFYRNHVIPLTKEGEVAYFLHRRS
jgi:chorismate mutase